MDKDDINGVISLVPFAIFAVFYLGLSLASGDFYRVPMIIAFIVASASAFVLHPIKLDDALNVYTKGMGDANIMMMCLIFILAGAFASVAKATGAVDSA
ncbi:MAG: Na+/H+ antiporter NhaC family protein, partial [Lentisphaeria bacterium]|nr:Na+/H+ antiporter NhaC family protein [Lentisphaeria bacterium]